MRCSFPAERDFRAINAVDARFAAGRRAGWNDDVARKKAEFHQAARDVFRKIQAIEHASFSLAELCECTRTGELFGTALGSLLTLICSINQYPPPGRARQGLPVVECP